MFDFSADFPSGVLLTGVVFVVAVLLYHAGHWRVTNNYNFTT